MARMVQHPHDVHNCLYAAEADTKGSIDRLMPKNVPGSRGFEVVDGPGSMQSREGREREMRRRKIAQEKQDGV